MNSQDPNRILIKEIDRNGSENNVSWKLDRQWLSFRRVVHRELTSRHEYVRVKVKIKVLETGAHGQEGETNYRGKFLHYTDLGISKHSLLLLYNSRIAYQVVPGLWKIKIFLGGAAHIICEW